MRDVKDLAATIKKAFHIATTGRPGPVAIAVRLSEHDLGPVARGETAGARAMILINQ
ncbi:acetolactate synthase 3 catalytic subunit [compost metagenome]